MYRYKCHAFVLDPSSSSGAVKEYHVQGQGGQQQLKALMSGMRRVISLEAINTASNADQKQNRHHQHRHHHHHRRHSHQRGTGQEVQQQHDHNNTNKHKHKQQHHHHQQQQQLSPKKKVHHQGKKGSGRDSVAATSDRRCVVCFGGERNAVIIPCGHANVCKDCAETVRSMNRGCPTCRATIEGVYQTFDK